MDAQMQAGMRAGRRSCRRASKATEGCGGRACAPVVVSGWVGEAGGMDTL